MGRRKKKDTPSKLLMKLVEAGQVVEIQEFLATIDDVPAFLCDVCVDGDGSNAMHRAAASGKTEVMQVLMDHGLGVSSRKDKSKTPLHDAAERGHCEAAAFLLQHGAEANVHKTNGWTPLMCAAAGGHNEVAKTVLSSGALINDCNREGATALYVSSREGHLSMVQLLLEKGAAANQPTVNGRVALHAAVMNEHANVIVGLIEGGADPSVQDSCGMSVLHENAQTGSIKVLELLLLHRARRHAHSDTAAPDTAELDTAAPDTAAPDTAGAVEGVAEKAWSAGRQHERANATERNGDMIHRQPIHYAALHGHIGYIEALLSHPDGLAAVDQQDGDGCTALYFACTKGYDELVAALLRLGADPSLASIRRSPLHLAMTWGRYACAKLLLEHGADVARVDWEGRTALQAAEKALQDKQDTQEPFERGPELFNKGTEHERCVDLLRQWEEEQQQQQQQ
jgi:ankyrin repeat protein